MCAVISSKNNNLGLFKIAFVKFTNEFSPEDNLYIFLDINTSGILHSFQRLVMIGRKCGTPYRSAYVVRFSATEAYPPSRWLDEA